MPTEGAKESPKTVDLSNLTSDELFQRAVIVAQRLKATADERANIVQEAANRTARKDTVIEATVIPEPTLEELQAQIKAAEEEVRLANEELARHNAEAQRLAEAQHGRG